MADFDEIKTSFWREGATGAQPPLTDEAVREAENLLGMKLPATLLDLLRIQNGGVVRDERCVYPTSEPTSWAEDQVPFDDLMGIGHAGSARARTPTGRLRSTYGRTMRLEVAFFDAAYKE